MTQITGRWKQSWWKAIPDRHDWSRNDGIGRQIYVNMETQEEVSSDRLPYAALYQLNPEYDYTKGYDGLSIACIIPRIMPSGQVIKYPWYIDARSSNCTMPDDNVHRCWVRHGTIGEIVHVNKNGNTCSAGAGSIAVEGFHGFLHYGELYSV